MRNVKLFAKNQDPELYLASKFEDFNFINLDDSSDDEGKESSTSAIMQGMSVANPNYLPITKIG
jgi:hypothetical protein